jgi:NitT/TauT family transport system permease protein
MGTVGQMTARQGAAPDRRVLALRVAIVATILVAWEALSASGLLFRDVVPSLVAIARSLAKLLTDAAFYWNLGITLAQIAGALAIGGIAGLAVGLALGANRFLSRAYESFIYYLGPTPKIIFFPIMLLWFGVGSGSKVAMGALSCFFPIVISAASGMREIDPVLVRVGASFRAETWQMVTKVYLPALRRPLVNGVRLGLGIAIIGVLLAETKLSNRGIGYLIIQAYATFDMPRMYALLIVLFVLAIGANTLIARFAGADASTLDRRVTP